jgi:S-adenosylmethionine decarboxylase
LADSDLPTVPFFEGAEKLLEIWFSPIRPEDNDAGTFVAAKSLRTLTREQWSSLLDLCNCTIVSVTKAPEIDSYVLSESSLFVWDDRMLLKTCGTTTLLRVCDALKAVAREQLGLVFREVFFSRKNFMRPDAQLAPHTSFEDEVEHLEQVLGSGAAHTIGHRKDDVWHVFTMHDMHGHLGGVAHDQVPADQTLEIVMTRLSPIRMRQFYRTPEFVDAKTTTATCGLGDIFPNLITDEIMFEPCGYSVNGIIDGKYYYTVHITPQPECSYVSFETNVPLSSYTELIERVISLFEPERFSLSLFTSTTSLSAQSGYSLNDVHVGNTRCMDRARLHLSNYLVTYAMFQVPQAVDSPTTPTTLLPENELRPLSAADLQAALSVAAHSS